MTTLKATNQISKIGGDLTPFQLVNIKKRIDCVGHKKWQGRSMTSITDTKKLKLKG